MIAGLIYPRPVGGAGPLGPGKLLDAARGGLAVRGEAHLVVSLDLSVPRRVVDLESPGRRPAGWAARVRQAVNLPQKL